MRRMLLIQSRVAGVLTVNGQFCGPLEGGGQTFPTGEDAEVYVQLFPFSREAPPLTAALRLSGGSIERLEPEDAAYALLWPDGILQLELAPAAVPEEAADTAETAADGALLRYLRGRLAGDAQAGSLLLRPQDGIDISGYEAVVPLRFAPMTAPERFDERAGLVRRLAPNIARVDAVLGATVPAGQGRRMLERVELIRT